MADLYDRYGRIVYSIVNRIVGNSGEAEEVVQEIFLRVWTRTHLIDGTRATVAPWLQTIARNLAIDHIRTAAHQDQRRDPVSYQFIPAPVSFQPALRLSNDAEQLRRAFDALTPNQRTVIEFAYFDGLTQNEIAERLGKPLGTIKTWARTALNVLRKSFDNHGCNVNPTLSEAGIKKSLPLATTQLSS
jgi:RNA polymerase sigma-70 factor (ECF subfamily)